MIDATHDPARTSWVESANGHADFPVQNLPFGVFSPHGGPAHGGPAHGGPAHGGPAHGGVAHGGPAHGGPARGGVAIGDMIFDIGAALEAGSFSGAVRDAAEAAAGPVLNPLLALGAGPRTALRRRIADLLDANNAECAKLSPRLLHRAADCTLHLPAAIGAYTDFFAGIHHAATAGSINRPENPLLPNYKYVPVAYHSRASSVQPSGKPVPRPQGQRKLPEESAPVYGPCRNLDYELELGMWIGPGNDLGTPIPIGEAAQHIAGFCLLNDWSARDIQSWESQPLGPFLAKSFRTSISPWIVTPEALAPFRCAQLPRPHDDPAPLPHLLDAADQTGGALDVSFAAFLLTRAMREAGAAPFALSQANGDVLYWTVAQMVAHHTSNGCNLQPGDLFGSGTLSGTGPGSAGCLLEMTRGGRDPVALPNGETRRYLEDGDEVIFHARCRAAGRASIGFGECRGRVG